MIPLLKKVILFSFLLLLTACIKNNFNQQNTLVPYTNVDILVPLYEISFPGSHAIRPGHGATAAGIIVFNIDGTNFRAFDLGCPYISPTDCSIGMLVDNATGEMSCAGCSNDDITFTQNIISVIIDEQEYQLRVYNAYLEGGVVRITNY